MNPSDPNPAWEGQAVSENDIESRDLKRRSFLKGLGIFTGITVFGLAATACEEDPVSNESDPVDEDTSDDFDLD